MLFVYRSIDFDAKSFIGFKRVKYIWEYLENNIKNKKREKNERKKAAKQQIITMANRMKNSETKNQ